MWLISQGTVCECLCTLSNSHRILSLLMVLIVSFIGKIIGKLFICCISSFFLVQGEFQPPFIFNLLSMYQVLMSFHCSFLCCHLELFTIHIIVLWVHYLIPGLKLCIWSKNAFHQLISWRQWNSTNISPVILIFNLPKTGKLNYVTECYFMCLFLYLCFPLFWCLLFFHKQIFIWKQQIPVKHLTWQHVSVCIWVFQVCISLWTGSATHLCVMAFNLAVVRT